MAIVVGTDNLRIATLGSIKCLVLKNQWQEINKQGKLIDYNRAMELFYNLQTFAKLNDGETVLCLESSDYIYAML